MKEISSGDGTIIVRPFAPGDLKYVHAIEKASFPDPWSQDSFMAELAHYSNLFWIAEQNRGTILGYCVCLTVRDELYIKKIAVDPAKRRNGIGRTLLTSIEEYALKNTTTKISLDCDEKNLGAQAFYAAIGFKPVTPQGLRQKKIIYLKELR